MRNRIHSNNIITSILIFFIFTNINVIYANNINDCKYFAENDNKIKNFLRTQKIQNPTMIGCSKFNIIGKKIYDIALYGINNKFDNYNQNIALIIHYNSSVSRDFIVKTSVKEIKRINPQLNNEEIDKIKLTLEKNLHDITKDDVKTAIFYPNKSSKNNYLEIFHNNKNIGNFDDINLSIYFLDIWLNKNAKFPNIRKELIN